jgi:hypothetical protein
MRSRMLEKGDGSDYVWHSAGLKRLKAVDLYDGRGDIGWSRWWNIHREYP